MWLWLEVCFQLLQRLPGRAQLSNPLLPIPAPHLLARAQPTPQEWFWAGAEGGKGEKNSVVTEQFQSSSSSLASLYRSAVLSLSVPFPLVPGLFRAVSRTGFKVTSHASLSPMGEIKVQCPCPGPAGSSLWGQFSWVLCGLTLAGGPAGDEWPTEVTGWGLGYRGSHLSPSHS